MVHRHSVESPSRDDGEQTSTPCAVLNSSNDEFATSQSDPSNADTTFGDSQLGLDRGYQFCDTDILGHNVILGTPSVQRDDDIWTTIDEFFDTAYLIFPVISYVDLTSRMIMEPDWETVPDLRTLLYSMRLLIAAARYRMNPQSTAKMDGILQQVESSRLTYDFADPATLDAVVCSMCLFTAYSVMGKHGRAFLYLNEAMTLLEAVAPSNKDEEQRKLRIQQVLFNTESATLAIYSSKDTPRKVRKPPLVMADAMKQNGFGTDIGVGQVALHLLQCLTWIYLAEEANEVEMIDLESASVMETLFGDAILKQHRFSRIQSADVMVTRQWQLSRKAVACSNGRGAAKRMTESGVASLGVVAMSWICLLKDGELRIVGLGKLAELALNMYRLANGTRYQDVLRGLTGAIMREDHEGLFALPLADLVISTLCTVPPQMELHGEALRSETMGDYSGRLYERTTAGLAESETELGLQTQHQVQWFDEIDVNGTSAIELFDSTF